MATPPTWQHPLRLALACLALLPLALTVTQPASAAPADARRVHPAARSVEVDLTASQPAASANADNPLAGGAWSVYHGAADLAYEPYEQASPTQRLLLDSFVQQPKAQWFTRWNKNSQIYDQVRRYIETNTAGDPDALVQMTIFRMDPWEDDACRLLPTAAQRAGFKDYVTQVARAIGDTRTAVVLQPDGPFALCAPHGSKVYTRLIGWAAKTLSAQPRTSVYIEIGSADWLREKIAPAMQMLVEGGIRYARGFALGGSHYDTTAHEVRFGARVVEELARRGFPGRHFVVDTSDNGRGFRAIDWRRAHPGLNYNNAAPCRTRTSQMCLALGIPPTTDVADARWGLPRSVAAAAAKHVDAYLWFGRPWIDDNSADFSMNRALQLGRTALFTG